MKDTVEILGKKFEYDFLSGWIKYTRLQNDFSQEALAHGICSPSHLSYFEKGKKKLRGEIIEALLRKLNISEIKEFENIGLIRQKFYDMMLRIESFDSEGAKTIYAELLSMENIISTSPYNIEYKIYQLMYNFFVEEKNYKDLKQDIIALDKVYSSLNEELQYLYMFSSGVIIYRHKDHSNGIERLLTAHEIKETPWLNYFLGYSYCFDNDPLLGTYYLQNSLEAYEKHGRYINALWCHNSLATCYSYLKIYDKSEKHLKAALTGAEHFNVYKILGFLYTKLSELYLYKEKYEESIEWAKKVYKTNENWLLPVAYHIQASMKLNRVEECKALFNKYLTEDREKTVYYPFLYFLHLSIFHFEEEIFYEKVTKEILPYYENISYFNLCKQIKLKLIEYLEKKRRYKEANKIYKTLID